ncbi:PLP-dependent aminotransferase family protein [Paludibacterium sp.]|uniref:aminotransferase-like domain-containing protein n=1 Tax=Paludibacterium sp. TaxID=1917523 RepID=UPI0025FEC999|nr:PLP-dependent aminotransferase family protein [Paludibacterium sp.]MBV8647423.1 PLP-dependent aminotransferase family protein [Paludibacterium sp.]
MNAKYLRLAAKLRGDIQQGRLAPGQRLPSIRAQARQQGVSLTTAIKSYEWLEAQGEIVAAPKSGFFVRARPQTARAPRFPLFDPHATPVDNAALIAEVRRGAQDPAHVPLGTVMLSPALLPLTDLQLSLARAARRAPQSAAGYGQLAGEPALRQALCRHFAEDGMALAPEDLLITNGCMPALNLALTAVSRPGDAIAVPSPCYSGQLQLLASLGRRVVEIPCHARGMDLGRFAACLAAGDARVALLSGNHHNPLGFCLSPEDKQRVAQLAALHRTVVIEDDVFGECGHGGPRPLPIKAWDSDGWVIWCGSFSKTLAPGYRIGWCAPGRHLPALAALHLSGMLAVNTPLQLALADFLNRGAYRRHLRRLQPALAAQVDRLSEAVLRHFPAGAGLARPDGGYAVWVQLPDGQDGLALYRAARAQGIGLVPGAVFSARGLYGDCLRLNAGNPWEPRIDQAVATLGKLARSI